jgi:sensor c-di-GMP phosphodiesterase-like protein
MKKHAAHSQGILILMRPQTCLIARRMRNRTAIRLLYVLAVVAGALPPVLFLGYAYRQGLMVIERDLEFVGKGTLARTESVLDTVGSTLRKVASLTQGRVEEPTLTTLRQAVFLDPYIQAIGIRRGNALLCTSERIYDTPQPILDPQLPPLPPPGELALQPPAERGFPTKSLVLVYTFAKDSAIEGLMNSQLFSEFFDYYARESDCRVFVYFGSGQPLTAFGKDGVPIPSRVDLDAGRRIQWLDGQLVSVAKSDRYPVYTVTAASAALIRTKMVSTALGFAVAGVLLSALLSTLVIRVARRTRSLEADLREAVKYGEIDVHYQPLIDLHTGRCVGAEALMRWQHPRRGMIPAGEFIAIAEKTDLILPMTEILLQKVASALGPLLRKDPTLHIGINLAPQHFSNTRILDAINAFAKTGIPASQIICEITERGLVPDENSVARTVMAGLAAAGAKLAVDDFGTGYSSLSYLQRFPLDFLKIDKAFVDGIESETASSGLVDQIIKIANLLELDIIAEGVEQPFQAAYLQAQGVHFAQGWYFGRPMPAHKFEDFVAVKNYGQERRSAPLGEPSRTS